MSESGSEKGSLLQGVESPADIKGLSLNQLQDLAEEIRWKIIETTSKTGGHLAPSLGTVELSIALHYVFDAPRDKIIWDVGHQAYTHKLLTGRRNQFHTLRTHGGISGFPKRRKAPTMLSIPGTAVLPFPLALAYPQPNA